MRYNRVPARKESSSALEVCDRNSTNTVGHFKPETDALAMGRC